MPVISSAIGYGTKLVAIEMIFRPTEFRDKDLLNLITGGTTDWIALHMIFRPIEPGQRLFGVMPWQGVFHKLRDEVCSDYATLLAKDILTPKAVMESLLNGPMSDKLFEMVQDEIKATIDDQTGIARPFVAMAIGGRKYQRMKQRIAPAVTTTRIPTARDRATRSGHSRPTPNRCRSTPPTRPHPPRLRRSRSARRRSAGAPIPSHRTANA
jgi:uncharacterized membrane protein YheB (UPF0754 family)